MNLTTQKRLAASILKVGLNRVWIDPERIEEVSMAITRDGVKQLINDGAIKAKPEKGISSYRSKKIKEQNIPKCPICGSTDLKKLSALDRGVSAFMFGLGSNKIGKTYECKNCKATF